MRTNSPCSLSRINCVLYFHKIRVLTGLTSLRGSLLSYYRCMFGHPAVKANLIWITAIFTAGIFTPSALTLFVRSRCSGLRRIILISVFCRMPSLTSCHWRGEWHHGCPCCPLSHAAFICWERTQLRQSCCDRNTIYDCYQWWRRTWKC